jgi:hypothetical protein
MNSTPRAGKWFEQPSRQLNSDDDAPMDSHSLLDVVRAPEDVNSVLAKNEEIQQEWHILMLQSTLQAPGNTAKRVSRCLQEVLHLELDDASQKIGHAHRSRMTWLATLSSRGEVFEKVQALRHMSISVTVVSELGWPGTRKKTKAKDTKGRRAPESISSSPPSTSSFGDYSELFRRTFAAAGGQTGGSTPRLRDLRMATSQRRLDDVGMFRTDSARALLARLPQEPQEPSLRKKGSLLWQNTVADKSKRSGVVSIADESEDLPEGADAFGGVGGILDGMMEAARENISILDAVSSKQKLPGARKEACEFMRVCVFGCIGNEQARNHKERNAVYYQSCGDKEKILQLFGFWERLDDDGSGRVDIVEFKAITARYLVDKMQAIKIQASLMDSQQQFNVLDSPLPTTADEATKFTAKLGDKLMQVVLVKKVNMVIEDFMRVIWPCCAVSDMKYMWKVYKDALKENVNRIPTPPILPEAEFDGLCSVFRSFDDDGDGTVRLEELVEHGLIHAEAARSLFKDYDDDGDGRLDLLEFCVMMCPSGYRAHGQATLATSVDGTRLCYDSKSDKWQRVSSEAEAEVNRKRRSVIFG